MKTMNSTELDKMNKEDLVGLISKMTTELEDSIVSLDEDREYGALQNLEQLVYNLKNR